jgi:endonuclease/exonuclease/phosphatase family metal-dependent hydrolase
MPPHGKPDDPFAFRKAHEIRALDAHFDLRNVPPRAQDRLLLACWNIANFGVQNRSDNALDLLAHICGRFDLIAVQEVNENWHPLADMVERMGPTWDFIMSDTAGNSERLAFVFDRDRVTPKQLFGEVALRARDFPKRDVTVHYTYYNKPKSERFDDLAFEPFDRNPYIGSFACGSVDLTLANCHLYYGKGGNPTTQAKRQAYARRVMEVHALARWADKRSQKDTTYDQDIILLGDMNVPDMTLKQASYRALIEYGMQPLKYASRVGGSNLSGKNTYDQMAFAPGRLQTRIIDYDVFDFDNAVFAGLWEKLDTTADPDPDPDKRVSEFRSHVNYHLSDHRPLWVQLDVS